MYQINSKTLFPKELLKCNILPTLSLTQIEMLKCQKFFKSSEEYKKIDFDSDIENSLFESSINSFETVDNFEFLSHLSKLSGF